MLEKIFQQGRLKKDLTAFLEEMDKNLELFYVMDQRQFIIHGFKHEAWPLVKDQEIVRKHEAIGSYVRAIEEFNAALKEHKAYEQWYASDMQNKTPENAKKLHGLKNALDAKLKGMEAVIILAGQALEKEMLHLGLLKA